jgi:hypothetical protein
MSDRFDELTRQMAGAMPRRRALRLMGATVAAGAAAVVARPFRGDANGVCAAGEQRCGSACCPSDTFCSSATAQCCCPKGATPCGASCCAKGVACLDAANGVCGCQPRTTPCGTSASPTCCPAGTACTSGCPPPSGNEVKSLCFFSDRDVKKHMVPVRWEGG